MLTRKKRPRHSAEPPEIPIAAERRQVDYDGESTPNLLTGLTSLLDESSLIAALADVDILVSCLGGKGLQHPQSALIRAAKKANVKLFIPRSASRLTALSNTR